ncbi:MAG: Hydrogen peroxide-inducible genes activator [Alphaproteobacteria bacterium MarineAlpha6_Bin6]|nr:MAG: Hydrogen peroxide-inducible genes activator [Alphaproteobacteria bacterium MarineAlpha6_Bin6]PPR32702.1 MAG: Hydrogen peroxide-inducible genes activator [Alphaproteobacteria bacterium MarineAlpha6_Bin5]|tara:strand:+ start:158 stop:1057 length:900 start_codon:yes stop_codon:yes gene_type:complete
MFHPTFRQLKYLVSISKNLHFGKAAKECFVSQSTLSSGIQELERLLNVKLLERTKRTVFLTPLGKEISKKAESINIEMNDVLDLVKSAQEKMFGETRLGVIPTIAPYLLPKLMPKIRKHYPGLNLKLVEDQTANILSMLYSGSLDLILIAKPYKTENLNVELIKKDFFHVALPFNSNLLKIKKKSLNNSDISQTNMLLLDEGHCLRDHALQACSKETKQKIDAFKATSLLTLVQMVANNTGITLLPDLVINSELLKNSKIKILDYENNKNFREIALCWRLSSPRNNDFSNFASFLRKSI